MRKFLLGLVALGCATAANADTVLGPAYPPPGGVTYSGNGVQAQNGTLVRTYTNFNLDATGDLWYGITSLGLAMDGTINGSTPEQLTYAAGLSNLAGGTAIFTGQTTIYVNNAAQLVNTRMTMSVTDLAGTALALTTNPSVTLYGGIDPLLLVTGDFKASFKLEAAYASGGGYLAASTLFNNASIKTGPSDTSQGGQPLKTDFGTNFYYTEAAVPEPATWAMMIIGFGAVGFTLRQRKTMAIAA